MLFSQPKKRDDQFSYLSDGEKPPYSGFEELSFVIFVFFLVAIGEWLNMFEEWVAVMFVSYHVAPSRYSWYPTQESLLPYKPNCPLVMTHVAVEKHQFKSS